MEAEAVNTNVSATLSADVQAKSFSVVALRASDGRYLGTRSVSDLTIVASREVTDVFDQVKLESGKVALRSIRSGRFVSVAGTSGPAATGEEIGPAETFTALEFDGGKVAFQISGGTHYLSAREGDDTVLSSADSVGTGELFSVEPAIEGESEEVAPHQHGCCGLDSRKATTAPGEVGPLWEKETHSQVIENGVHLLRKAHEVEAREFIRLWDTGPGFSGATKKGLEDADELSPYSGDRCLGVQAMWDNHFYNPSTERSYTGAPNTAVTDGRRYFNLAVHTGRRIQKLGAAAPAELYRRAGYYLGLSLHFLTDLTQPMHAAGFTSIYGESYPGVCTGGHLSDYRHSGYEEYTEERVKKGYFNNYPPLQPGDIDITGITKPDTLLIGAAKASKPVFVDKLLHTVRKKVETIIVNNRILYIFHNKWTAAQADEAIDSTLWNAPRAVARYVVYWTRCIMNQPLEIDHKRWYRIIEPTMGRPVILRSGHFVRGNENEGDNSRFYVLFNPDGTVSLACKQWKAHLWYMYNTGARFCVGEDYNANGNPKKESRFRLVAAPNNKVWIFEPTLDEAIGVSSDSYLQRWNPCDEATQLYSLVPGEEINSTDYAEIKKLFPYFGDYQWWGNATA
jgi:hypothetical protein